MVLSTFPCFPSSLLDKSSLFFMFSTLPQLPDALRMFLHPPGICGTGTAAHVITDPKAAHIKTPRTTSHPDIDVVVDDGRSQPN